MKKWRMQIRVCNGKLANEEDCSSLSDEHWEYEMKHYQGAGSAYGGAWYFVEVTSDEIGVEDDGNIAS